MRRRFWLLVAFVVILCGSAISRLPWATAVHAQIFHRVHRRTLSSTALAAFQIAQGKPHSEYTVVLDQHFYTKDGKPTAKAISRQTFSQRADGARAEVFERPLATGIAKTRTVTLRNGETAVVSDALGLKTSTQASAENAARIWANRQSPTSNCLVSNAGDQTAYTSTGVDVIGGFRAIKKVYADGNIVWSAPDLDCAEVEQFSPGEHELDAKLELASSSVGTPDSALFITDGFNEVVPSDFDIAVEKHAFFLTGQSYSAEYISKITGSALARNKSRDDTWRKWQAGLR